MCVEFIYYIEFIINLFVNKSVSNIIEMFQMKRE